MRSAGAPVDYSDPLFGRRQVKVADYRRAGFGRADLLDRVFDGEHGESAHEAAYRSPVNVPLKSTTFVSAEPSASTV